MNMVGSIVVDSICRENSDVEFDSIGHPDPFAVRCFADMAT